MEATLTITLQLPPMELSPNARPHHMAKANATKAYRYEAKIACLEAMAKQYPRGKAGSAFWNALPFTKARAFPTFYFKSRGRRDKHNLPVMLKPAWDGLQVERKPNKKTSPAWIGAGLIVDDNILDVMPHDVLVDKNRPRVEIFLELEA